MFEPSSPFAVSTDHQLPGCVLTVARRDEVIVWLIGEIDLSVAPDLAQIAEHAPPVAGRLVIDGSRLTYCDSSLAHFISVMCDSMQVVVRRPSQVFADLLAATELYHRVLVRAESPAP
jgi:anti-anti-sigma regulatory factor